MTTIIFYNGIMGSDSLSTRFKDVNSTKLDNIDSFDFYDKLRFIEINGSTHLFGFCGSIDDINNFFDNFDNFEKFVPKRFFSVYQWDGKKLYFYDTDEIHCAWKTLLNAVTFNIFKLQEKTLRVVRKNLKYGNNDLFSIGSGSEYVGSSFSKLSFQFKRKNEDILDHLLPEEIIKYLIMIASFNDIGTNDKIHFASLDRYKYTCIPSECESVERVIGSM